MPNPYLDLFNQFIDKKITFEEFQEKVKKLGQLKVNPKDIDCGPQELTLTQEEQDMIDKAGNIFNGEIV
jgi:hypothetical protein